MHENYNNEFKVELNSSKKSKLAQNTADERFSQSLAVAKNELEFLINDSRSNQETDNPNATTPFEEQQLKSRF